MVISILHNGATKLMGQMFFKLINKVNIDCLNEIIRQECCEIKN